MPAAKPRIKAEQGTLFRFFVRRRQKKARGLGSLAWRRRADSTGGEEQ